MRLNREQYAKYSRFCPPGTVLFKEGESGKEMYIIIQGEVEIRKSTSATSSKTLSVFHQGDMFGEMALVEKKPRSAAAVVTQPSKLLVIDEAMLDSLIVGNPDFALKLIKILAERLRRANALIQSIVVTNQQNQILDGLKDYARGFGIPTFKGTRVNVMQFIQWAQDHLGIKAREVYLGVQGLMKKDLLRPSVLGKEEVLVPPSQERTFSQSSSSSAERAR